MSRVVVVSGRVGVTMLVFVLCCMFFIGPPSLSPACLCFFDHPKGRVGQRFMCHRTLVAMEVCVCVFACAAWLFESRCDSSACCC